MLVFALLGVNQNKIEDVLKRLKKLGDKNINKLHIVYGEYDIIAELKADDPEASADLLRKIKETAGVNTLKTYVVSDQITDNNMGTVLVSH